MGKGRYGVVCRYGSLCDPYRIALEAFANTRYTNRRYLYVYLYTTLPDDINTYVEIGKRTKWLQHRRAKILNSKCLACTIGLHA